MIKTFAEEKIMNRKAKKQAKKAERRKRKAYGESLEHLGKTQTT